MQECDACIREVLSDRSKSTSLHGKDVADHVPARDSTSLKIYDSRPGKSNERHGSSNADKLVVNIWEAEKSGLRWRSGESAGVISFFVAFRWKDNTSIIESRVDRTTAKQMQAVLIDGVGKDDRSKRPSGVSKAINYTTSVFSGKKVIKELIKGNSPLNIWKCNLDVLSKRNTGS